MDSAHPSGPEMNFTAVATFVADNANETRVVVFMIVDEIPSKEIMFQEKLEGFYGSSSCKYILQGLYRLSIQYVI
jgi:hypothetical protein